MPKAPDTARFAKRLNAMQVWVARDLSGPVGFVGMRRDGYVDLAFLLAHGQGRGIFRALMERLGPEACATHASLHAQPAFAALGFRVAHHEYVRRQGQRLRRAYMLR
jgi:GNAT superfamily N-acetyltransferase